MRLCLCDCVFFHYFAFNLSHPLFTHYVCVTGVILKIHSFHLSLPLFTHSIFARRFYPTSLAEQLLHVRVRFRFGQRPSSIRPIRLVVLRIGQIAVFPTGDLCRWCRFAFGLRFGRCVLVAAGGRRRLVDAVVGRNGDVTGCRRIVHAVRRHQW